MPAPSSTYRIQVRPGFDLYATADVCDYLATLGVGAVYLAPLLPSALGSVHGYDVGAYERIDSWLLRAFAGMPQMALPEFSRRRVPTRVFEMRDYESHSEERALSKMAMFNEGEIEVMKDLGMSPVFFGQALAGPNLPHLRYITCAADLATHLANWKKFGPDPRWMKMKDLPQYAGNTSKNTARFLVPTAFSAI